MMLFFLQSDQNDTTTGTTAEPMALREINKIDCSLPTSRPPELTVLVILDTVARLRLSQPICLKITLFQEVAHMSASASAVATLASCVARSFSPFSGDHVLLDEASRLVITNSGHQILESLEASVRGNPVASIAVQSAIKFGKQHGSQQNVLLLKYITTVLLISVTIIFPARASIVHTYYF